jgi:hypothetical protein
MRKLLLRLYATMSLPRRYPVDRMVIARRAG